MMNDLVAISLVEAGVFFVMLSFLTRLWNDSFSGDENELRRSRDCARQLHGHITAQADDGDCKHLQAGIRSLDNDRVPERHS